LLFLYDSVANRQRTMTATVLEFTNLVKEYKGFFQKKPFRALDDFSLTVQRGEIFGFLGPNGAGKTTSLHIALGLLFPTSGGGTLLGSPFGDARVRRHIGFLAENVSYFNLPAKRLVSFYGGLNGMRDPQLREHVKELLDTVELGEVANKKVGNFSRGMLQKVGLAQALVNDPELLILDEPTSALDPAARVRVREILLRAKSQGKTVFLSSHLLSEIELICDRIGILSKGKLVKAGTVSELVESRHECEIVSRRAGEETSITVPLAEQRRVIESIWVSGGEIVSVSPVRKTLEELFLELTARDRVQ
jgi:ABC-2 type transport system ATP-binding protein